MSKASYKVTSLKNRIDIFEVFQKFKQSAMEEYDGGITICLK